MGRTAEVVDRYGVTARRQPVRGDLHWDGTRWRRWNGKRFVRAAYSLDPARLENPRPLTDEAARDEARCARVLERAAEDQVLTNGATVVHQARHAVVLGYRPPVSHLTHAILTVLTGGLWLVVWLYLALTPRQRRVRLEVDTWGNVWGARVADA